MVGFLNFIQIQRLIKHAHKIVFPLWESIIWDIIQLRISNPIAFCAQQYEWLPQLKCTWNSNPSFWHCISSCSHLANNTLCLQSCLYLHCHTSRAVNQMLWVWLLAEWYEQKKSTFSLTLLFTEIAMYCYWSYNNSTMLQFVKTATEIHTLSK